MIDHNHPAVEAASKAWGESAPTTTAMWAGMSERRRDLVRARMVAALTAALPHLESATEDNLARLRNTPAGRALMAEGWDRGVADNERGWEHVYAGHDVDPDDPLGVCQTCGTPNPYRTEVTRDAPEG